MIKLLTSLIILTLFVLIPKTCHAAANVSEESILRQKQLTETGFKILSANNIENRMTFRYKDIPKLKISTSLMSKKIYVYKDMMSMMEDENELAALLSREIAFVNDSAHGAFRRTSMSYSPLKYEKKADKRAVDYMVNAGFNPIALIVVLNKRTGEPKWFEQYFIAHKGSERQIYTYAYIYDKYPSFISHNEYLENPYYQNFLRTTVQSRAEIKQAKELKIKTGNET